MEEQVYNWTCSVCSFTWVINSTGIDPNLTREKAGQIIGYPNCVNETYGLMSAQCLIDAFAYYGLHAKQGYYSFGEAHSICTAHTGVINPIGMYHFMAVRGITDGDIWVANSAPGYRGIVENLDQFDYNELGPTQLIWIP